MKKIMILVIGVLILAVSSSAALNITNTVFQVPKPDITDTVIQLPPEPDITNATYMLPKPDLVNTTIQLSPDIFTGFIVVPAPLTPRFVNCTVNFTVVFPIMANVYTDKEVYAVGETVTYGIENTLNYNIGGVSVSIQKDVNENWMPVVLTYCMPLLLEPGQTYESTWDQKFNGRQVETGMYRVAIGYGYYDGILKHGTGYAYFSIANTYSVVPPSGDFPLSVTIMNNTGTHPFVIPPGFLPVNWTIENNADGTPFITPPGYPWVTPLLPVYYLEDD